MLAAPASHVALKLVTAGDELFSATDAIVKEELKLDEVVDANKLNLSLATAREQFELETGLALLNQVWEASWDAIPCSSRNGTRYRALKLGRAPLVSISSATYVDASGVSTSWTVGGNLVAAGVGQRHEFGRAVLTPGTDWPALGDYPEAFRIRFTAGFGAAVDDVPEGIRQAILMLALHYYQIRTPVNVGNIVTPIPEHMRAIIGRWRVPFLT